MGMRVAVAEALEDDGCTVGGRQGLRGGGCDSVLQIESVRES